MFLYLNDSSLNPICILVLNFWMVWKIDTGWWPLIFPLLNLFSFASLLKISSQFYVSKKKVRSFYRWPLAEICELCLNQPTLYRLSYISTTAISTANFWFGQKLSTNSAPASVSLHFNTQVFNENYFTIQWLSVRFLKHISHTKLGYLVFLYLQSTWCSKSFLPPPFPGRKYTYLMGTPVNGSWNFLELLQNQFSRKEVLYGNGRDFQNFKLPSFKFSVIVSELDMIKSQTSPFWKAE